MILIIRLLQKKNKATKYNKNKHTILQLSRFIKQKSLMEYPYLTFNGKKSYV